MGNLHSFQDECDPHNHSVDFMDTDTWEKEDPQEEYPLEDHLEEIHLEEEEEEDHPEDCLVEEDQEVGHQLPPLTTSS